MAPKTRKRKTSSTPRVTPQLLAQTRQTNTLPVTSNTTKLADVPELTSDEGYETWKTKIKKWCVLNSLDHQALFISIKLKNKAYRAVENIDAEKLKGEEGMTLLFDALDKVFLPDKIQRLFDLYCLLHTMKRSPDKDIHDFLNEFDFEYKKFQAVYGALLEPIPAFMLLLACALNETEGRVVRAGLRDDVNYDSMRETLKRVFSAKQSAQFNSAADTKTKQIFFAGDEGTAMTSEANWKFDDETFLARGGYNSRNVRRRSGGRSQRLRGGTRSRGARRFNGYRGSCWGCGSLNIFSGIALKGTKLILMISGRVDKMEETGVRAQIKIGMSTFHSLLAVKQILQRRAHWCQK